MAFTFTTSNLSATDINKPKNSYNWKKISGRWNISNNQLIETRGWANIFGYSPLINRNSIISLNKFDNFNQIKVKLTLKSRYYKKNYPPDIFIFFNASNYKNFYAINIKGDGKNINTVSILTYSDINSSLPGRIKWNFTKKILDIQKGNWGKDGKPITVNIYLKGKQLICSINNKILAKSNYTTLSFNKKIGFSNLSGLVNIDKIELLKDRVTIFKDDFTKNTLKQPKYFIKKVSK